MKTIDDLYRKYQTPPPEPKEPPPDFDPKAIDELAEALSAELAQ